MATISVIVPVYKVEPYLRRCVDSILAQTYTDFELILVDDGSPDNCGKICDEYAAKDKRIKVIHQANGGLSAARNAGIDWTFKNSESQFITFIDSDDWVSESYLHELSSGISRGAQVSCIGIALIRPNGATDTRYTDRGWRIHSPEHYWMLEDDMKDSAVAKLYAKSIFTNIRYPVGHVSEEVFTTHKCIFAASNIAVRYLPAYFYFIRGESITTAPNITHKKELLTAIHAQHEFFIKRNLNRLAEYTRGRECICMAAVRESIKATDPKFADELTSAIRLEMTKRPLPFWNNRYVYRHIKPWTYRILWPIMMIINTFTKGQDSWLLRDMLPVLKSIIASKK